MQRINAQAAQREARLREAASYFANALYDGWDQAVAERVAKYVTHQTWQELMSGSSRRHCKRLAKLARQILKGKDDLHDAVGATAATMGGLMGLGRVERVFAAELAKRSPLPADRPLVTLATSVQMIGVTLCVAAGRDPYNCPCFRDLAETKGKEQATRLLLSAADDYWTTHYEAPSPRRAAQHP